MKKTLSFEKDLNFKTRIGEVTTIDFEDNLKFVDNSNIEGNFYISGKYKMHEASTITEDFSFSLPITIAMMENYDLNTTKISIDNFTYEVIDDDILRCNINVLVEGVEEVVLEKEKEHVTSELIDVDDLKERDCDDDVLDDSEKEIPIKEEKTLEKRKEVVEEERDQTEKKKKEEKEKTKDSKKQKKEEKSIEEEKKEPTVSKAIKMDSLFANLGDDVDTFTTYSVYIMREGDSLDKVMDQYHVKKEDLEDYNDLRTIELNSKVIIPNSRDE